MAETRGENTVYLWYHHKDGFRNGGFKAQGVGELAEDGDHYLYELIPTKLKRKFYLDYETDVPNDETTPEEHQRTFEEL